MGFSFKKLAIEFSCGFWHKLCLKWFGSGKLPISESGFTQQCNFTKW